MANSSIQLTSLDFDSLKSSLKSYLREQDIFLDYDFEGSNINVLLDILSYNTYLNAMYLNMVGNEMFMDSAQLRDSVVSHAKELNYLPRSFASSVANVDIKIVTTDPNKRSTIIPKGTQFTTKVGNQNFLFSTDDNIIITSANTTFLAQNVRIYEGIFQSDSYAVNYEEPLRYRISAKNVDVSSITLTVVEDNGKTPIKYLRANSLFGLNADSRVFFIQASYGDQYEIVFGDGVIGRRPKNNSVIIVEYRTSSGELPNGANVFKPVGAIDSETNITITTNERASSGAVAESVQSIKYNAPRYFTTQERAITTEDYENLLKIQYPEINTVSAYGGEDLDPPQYGRVFITVDLKDFDGVPQIKKDEYYKFLKPRCPVAIDPIFIDAQYLYLYVNTIVKYNINVTSLNTDDITARVVSQIRQYATDNLNNFNSVFRYSKLVSAIDGVDTSIVSNETDILLTKYVTPILNTNQNLTIDFTVPLALTVPELQSAHESVEAHTISSSRFVFDGKQAIAEDDGVGNMRIVVFDGVNHVKAADIGTVDYETGVVRLNDFRITAFEGSYLKFYAKTRAKDIQTSKNIILNILESDVIVDAQPVRV